MASVHQRDDRGGQWEVRWRDPETGDQRSKLFDHQRDAKRHGVKMEAAKLDGTYLDASAAKVTFKL